MKLTRADVTAIRDEHGGIGPLAYCGVCRCYSPCTTRRLANLALAALRPLNVADKGHTP